MIRRFTFIPLLGLLGMVLLPCPASAQEAAAKVNGPRIGSPEIFKDLGTLESGPKVESFFTIQNTGTQPLSVIRVQATCGCTTPTYKPKVLPPGASDKVPFIFDTKDRVGIQEKQLVVFSDDPENPEFLLTFRADLTSLLTLTPRSIGINSDHKKSGVKRVRITNNGKKPMTIERFGIADERKVTARLEVLKEGREFELIVTSNPSLPLGAYSTEIRLFYKGDKEGSERIGVYGNVLDKIAVSPEKLTLQPSAEPVTRQLFIRTGSVREFKVLSAEWKDVDVPIEIENRMPRGYIVRIGPTPIDRASMNLKPIIIRTDVPGKEIISVPVQVVLP